MQAADRRCVAKLQGVSRALDGARSYSVWLQRVVRRERDGVCVAAV